MKTNKCEIIGKSPEAVTGEISRAGLAKYVSKQVLDWIYKKNKLEPEDYKNISKSLVK